MFHYSHNFVMWMDHIKGLYSFLKNDVRGLKMQHFNPISKFAKRNYLTRRRRSFKSPIRKLSLIFEASFLTRKSRVGGWLAGSHSSSFFLNPYSAAAAMKKLSHQRSSLITIITAKCPLSAGPETRGVRP